jgi:ubiquinone/menaquinone biosynthesis C-methylase UbiE
MLTSVGVAEVRDFWNGNPCQSELSQRTDRCEYFEEISRKRFCGREWHVPTVAQFGAFAGKDVLEIGCGIGTDGVEFAKRGARYIGMDLTPNSIRLARERFALFNVAGQFEVANAEERIPFPDDTFDHIYSFGAIHHSPRTEAIVDEMYRVLRPGGTFTVMVYNRSSINYRIEIMALRKAFRLLLYPRGMPRLVSRVTGFAEWKLVGHRERLRAGRPMSKEEWISMNTDGPRCPLAKVYGRHEAAQLFWRFRDVRQEVWEFNSEHWPFISGLLPLSLERAIGRLWGWHRMIYGRK